MLRFWGSLTRLALLMATLSPLVAATTVPEHVILLHGLCRTSRSMQPLEQALIDAGYRVVNVDYPSRSAPIDQLSEQAISPAVVACARAGASRIHFVTHSLGGILVRRYLAAHNLPCLGRVVMLGPPNQGSEIVDHLGSWKIFSLLNGPAGRQLGTAADSVPNQLGPATFSLGVIAGNRSINWINSWLIPGPDDGKVSVERTKLAGMSDHVIVAAAHPFLMSDAAVIQHTLHFLRTGRFDHSTATPSSR